MPGGRGSSPEGCAGTLPSRGAAGEQAPPPQQPVARAASMCNIQTRGSGSRRRLAQPRTDAKKCILLFCSRSVPRASRGELPSAVPMQALALTAFALLGAARADYIIAQRFIDAACTNMLAVRGAGSPRGLPVWSSAHPLFHSLASPPPLPSLSVGAGPANSAPWLHAPPGFPLPLDAAVQQPHVCRQEPLWSVRRHLLRPLGARQPHHPDVQRQCKAPLAPCLLRVHQGV